MAHFVENAPKGLGLTSFKRPSLCVPDVQVIKRR